MRPRDAADMPLAVKHVVVVIVPRAVGRDLEARLTVSMAVSMAVQRPPLACG